MRFLIATLFILCLSGCKVGEFTPERHAIYESPVDCEKTPQRCIQGYPW